MNEDAYKYAKIDIIRYLDVPIILSKDIDQKIGDAVSSSTSKTQDIIAILKWLQDKKYFVDNKNKNVISDYVLYRYQANSRRRIETISKIRSINPSRIIAILDWFYLNTNDLLIDYDYIIDVIKAGKYEKDLYKSFDQTELLEWLEIHKSADDTYVKK